MFIEKKTVCINMVYLLNFDKRPFDFLKSYLTKMLVLKMQGESLYEFVFFVT